MSENNQPKSLKEGIWFGIGAAGLAHVLFAILIKMFTVYGWLPFLLIGIVQLVYLVPLSLLVLLNKQYGRAMSVGIWIAVGITFLLNAACFGLVLSGAINIGL